MADYSDCSRCGEKQHSGLLRAWLDERRAGSKAPFLCPDCKLSQPSARPPPGPDGSKALPATREETGTSFAELERMYRGSALGGQRPCRDGLCGGCASCEHGVRGARDDDDHGDYLNDRDEDR